MGTVRISWKGSNTYVNAISHIVVGVKPLTIIRKFGSGEGQSEKPNPNVLLYFQSALFPHIRLISIKILCLSSYNFLRSEPPTCVCVCVCWIVCFINVETKASIEKVFDSHHKCVEVCASTSRPSRCSVFVVCKRQLMMGEITVHQFCLSN